MSNNRQYESLRRDFTDEEMARMHGELVQRCGEVKTLRAEKAQATTTLNAGIKTAETAVWDLQEKLSLGYEYVDVEVLTLYDTPAPGHKRILRLDNNVTVREEPMTPREKQQSFGFQDLPDDRPEGQK